MADVGSRLLDYVRHEAEREALRIERDCALALSLQDPARLDRLCLVSVHPDRPHVASLLAIP